MEFCVKDVERFVALLFSTHSTTLCRLLSITAKIKLLCAFSTSTFRKLSHNSEAYRLCNNNYSPCLQASLFNVLWHLRNNRPWMPYVWWARLSWQPHSYNITDGCDMW